MTATANAASPPSIAEQAINLGRRARLASKVLMQAPDAPKSRALRCMAEQIQARRKALKAANARDLEAARANQLTPALMDRLTLSDKALDTMIAGLQQIAAMADPVGSQSPSVLRPNGMRVGQMRVPLGVIGIIYESRPNVTIDAAALCLKSGNAAILRGGSEAFHSNQALEQVLHAGLEAAGLPLHSVQVVNTTDRAMVGELITLTDYVDVIIPRGGKNLIARLAQEARVPLLKHLDGNCHVYVDAHADLTKAAAIAFNAKTYRYGVCGAMETLLVHQNVAAEFLPPMAQRFLAHGVELRGCVRACAFSAQMSPASDEDWASEYLAAILAVKVVDNLDQAIAHVNRWGSGHTDAIVTESLAQAARFQREVDSSSVYVNLPTCFADGFEYGLGAEIGISTNRLHARGPVGLEGLTTYKWVLTGDGQIRE